MHVEYTIKMLLWDIFEARLKMRFSSPLSFRCTETNQNHKQIGKWVDTDWLHSSRQQPQ